MMKPFKPMLSGKAPTDLSKLTYPLLASPKLDGIRCVKLDGEALTRSLKPIPNDYIREWVEVNLPDGIDGELLLRDWTAPYREVCSAVMRKSGQPDFTFAAFDLLQGIRRGWGFQWRLRGLVDWVEDADLVGGILQVVPHTHVNTPEALEEMMDRCIGAGFEGVMVRDREGPYKMGRSTLKEGYLLKIKLWEDDEAEVIGLVEQLHNANEAQTNELGRTKRSTCKEGMVPAGTLGALKVRFADGTEFEVGTGLDDKTRAQVWAARDREEWPLVKVKHQPSPGGRPKGEKPRFPVFLGFRSKLDL